VIATGLQKGLVYRNPNSLSALLEEGEGGGSRSWKEENRSALARFPPERRSLIERVEGGGERSSEGAESLRYVERAIGAEEKR